MENASKALIMAASVLIGIMILSLAVYLFTTFGATSARLHEQQATDRLNQFNSQFTSYEGKSGLTIYDVITVANLATENNKYYQLDRKISIPAIENTNNKITDYYVSICIKQDGGTLKNIDGGLNTSPDYNEYINNELSKINTSNTKLPTYKCKAYISSTTQRVYRVDFVKE